MSPQQLSRQMEQDVSYLLWRGNVYQQSQLNLQLKFAELASSYRMLVTAEQQELLETLIARYSVRFN
ncbi:MAG: hypothetical protein ACJAWL_000010 [Motiliproteus sp.]|jgi:hypothetical protein